MDRSQELSDKIGALETVVANQQGVQDAMIVVINGQRAEIVDLKAQLAAGTVLTDAELDSALSRVDALIASEGLQTDEDNQVIAPPPPPPPPPAPGPDAAK